MRACRRPSRRAFIRVALLALVAWVDGVGGVVDAADRAARGLARFGAAGAALRVWVAADPVAADVPLNISATECAIRSRRPECDAQRQVAELALVRVVNRAILILQLLDRAPTRFRSARLDRAMAALAGWAAASGAAHLIEIGTAR
jgi:hypothetical protein